MKNNKTRNGADNRSYSSRQEKERYGSSTDSRYSRESETPPKTSNRKSTKPPKKASTGKAYAAAAYVFISLFLAMIVYMIYFNVEKSDEVKSNTYNTRTQESEEQIVRGSILADDGTMLAYTTTDEEGNEIRNYPYENLFAQVVGYSDYGSAGMEATLNSTLMESNENVINRLEKDLNSEKKTGDDVVTSLNINMQSIAYNALGGRKGAAVVLDASTSKVLACVSQPDFNPNTIYEDWETLNLEDSGSPFLNRALQGMYEPGSTFKIVTALAYLQQYGGDASFYYNCTGEYTQGGYTIHCINGTAHGEQTLADAFAHSCNCAFSYIATELLDSDALAEAAASLQFNQSFSLGLPSAASSYSLEKTTADGLTMQTAIGQGDTLTTPMHMAMIAQSVYNSGEMLEPSFINQVQSADGLVVSSVSAKSLGTVMSADQALRLKDYMQGVVQYGTASSAFADLSAYNVAGKTGTAEYDNAEGYSHSWFTGFTNTGTGDIVVCVIIEEAGEGDGSAAQTAASIIQQWYEG